MKTRVIAVGWAAVVLLSASYAAVLAAPPPWQSAPPLNEARERFGAVVDECGNIYVLGGWNRTGGCSYATGPMVMSVEMLAFNPVTRMYASQWVFVPTTLPVARANFIAVIRDGFIYLIGGNLNGVPDPPIIAQVDRYDLVTGSWDSVAVPPPNTLRTDYGAVVDRQGRIWIVGGEALNSTPAFASTECFDPARSELGWQYGPQLNTARALCWCVMDGAGRLYAIGGYNPVSGAHISSVERLDPCTGDWTILDWSLPAPSIVDPEAGVGADGKIYVVGGWGTSWVNRTIRLEPDETKWSPCHDPTGWNTWSSLQTPRAEHSVVLGHDGFLYAIAGDRSGCVSFTSVEKLDTRRPIGDINGDNVVDFGDINPFVCLLTGK